MIITKEIETMCIVNYQNDKLMEIYPPVIVTSVKFIYEQFI